MIEKVKVKVYFEGEFVGLEVFTKEKKFLRYVERHEYIDGKRNYIIEDTDKFTLLGIKVFFKKVLEYFKGVAKVKFIYVPSKIKSFFEETEKHFDYAGRVYARKCWEEGRAMRAYYELC